MRIVKRAEGETAREQRRRTVHGSPHKGTLSTLGAVMMRQDAKPSGFLFKADSGPRGGAGRRPWS